MNLINSLKKTRRSKNFRNPDEISAEVSQFIQRMETAVEEDVKANREEKLAYCKAKMIGEVVNTLQKKNLQDSFISQGLLSTLQRWLEPLPD